MAASRDRTITWKDPFHSPLRWLVLVHGILFVTVLVLWTAYPTSDILGTVDGSLVIAQLLLIGTCTSLHSPEGKWPLESEEMMLLLLSGLWRPFLMAIPIVHAFLVRSPMWISPPIFANVFLMSLRSKGWQLKRFERDAMPEPREFQFTISRILMVTVFVAVLFGVNAISSLLRARGGVFEMLAILPELAIVFAVYGIAPVIADWAVLSPGRMSPRLVATGFALGLVVLLLAQDAEERLAVQLISAPILAGSLAIFVVSLFVLRAMRYRVVWGAPMPGLLQALRNDSGHKSDA